MYQSQLRLICLMIIEAHLIRLNPEMYLCELILVRFCLNEGSEAW